MSEYLVLKDGKVRGPVPADSVEPIIENGRMTGYIVADEVIEGLPVIGDDPRTRRGADSGEDAPTREGTD